MIACAEAEADDRPKIAAVALPGDLCLILGVCVFGGLLSGEAPSTLSLLRIVTKTSRSVDSHAILGHGGIGPLQLHGALSISRSMGGKQPEEFRTAQTAFAQS